MYIYKEKCATRARLTVKAGKDRAGAETNRVGDVTIDVG